ncbi:MAG: SDR family NAD(P)-dependent oxidoreductase [Christensenellales bacterium]|jgi:short-subunit dehydrogenase
MKKVMVITGASSGIGLALYKIAQKNGFEVVNLSRSENKETNTIICDVSSPEQVDKTFNEISKKYAKIDILVNNAGFGLSGVTQHLKLEQTQAIFQTNFFGTLYASQNALKLMAKGAKIVNISSACALFPLPYRSLYCASKAAVNLLSQSMAMELSNAGIGVVSICPGDTKTAFTANRVKNFETDEKYGQNIISATKKLDQREDKRMSAEFVSNKIFKIILKKKNKPQYIIGFKYKVFFAFQKSLPIKVFNKVIETLFKK